MGASGAVNILQRRALASVAEEGGDVEARRAELVAEYEDAIVNPYDAADRGYVDAVIAPSETRAQRPWRGEGGPNGAEIRYKLAAPAAAAPRVLIVNTAGDTIARLTGTNTAGINRVSWNLQIISGDAPQFAGGGGGGRGRGGAQEPVNVAGFPRGFNPRPAEQNNPPDSSGSPTAQARELAAGRGGGRGGRGGGGGGGRGEVRSAETGDYRVVLDVSGQKQIQVLRVIRVGPGDVSVLAPSGR
jgi:hypothetical protein